MSTLHGTWNAADREREHTLRRYLVTFFVSLVLHLVVLIVLALWVGPAPLADEEVWVPLEFDTEPPAPEPVVEPVAPAEPAPQPAPAPEPRPDDSLLGFNSQGEIEQTPDRPVGPDGEVKGLPAPGEQAEAQITPPDSEPPIAPPEPEPMEPQPEREPQPEPEMPPQDEPVEDAPRDEFAPAPVEQIEDPIVDENAPAPSETARRQMQLPPSPARTPPAPTRIEPRRPGSLDFEGEIGAQFDRNLRFDSRDYNWSDYSTKLYFAIYRAWLRELHARWIRFERDQKLNQLSSLSGEVTIRFVIEADGSVNEVQVLAPSVLMSLDEASTAALTREPLPPLPDDFPRQREGVTGRFRIRFPSAQAMEMHLNRLRYQGQF